MHGGSRLAGAALLIGEDDEMTLAHLVCPRVALQREMIGGTNKAGESTVQIIHAGDGLEAALGATRGSGATLALVPTMGALHAGHLALVGHARTLADRVAVTIFVNPLQFNDATDLALYPRQEHADLAQLEAAGCGLVWLPTPEVLYAAGFATTVSVAHVSERWEGEHRPGHFN